MPGKSKPWRTRPGFLAFSLSIPIRSSDRHTQYSLLTKPCANYSVLPTIPPSMGSVAFAVVLLAEGLTEAQRESIEVTRSAGAPTFSTSLSGTQSPLVRSSPPGIQSVAKLPGKNLRGSLALWSWGDHSLLRGCQASKHGLGEGKERSSTGGASEAHAPCPREEATTGSDAAQGQPEEMTV